VRWASGKARELFLFLTVHPDGATRARIGRALWPEAAGAQLPNAFHVTLHHLRRSLGGREWVLHEAGRYRLARAERQDASLDIDLDAVLAAAARLRRARTRREALGDGELAALGAALARRSGPLGDGLSMGDWLIEHQDRVAAAWLTAMLDLGALHLVRESPAAVRTALGVFGSVLAEDPLREEAHREVMRCHVLLGEPARAVAHFEATRAVLQREVGSAPSRETVALADSIRRGAFAASAKASAGEPRGRTASR
jgi:DNA-binding SARP family transcriptional activator